MNDAERVRRSDDRGPGMVGSQVTVVVVAYGRPELVDFALGALEGTYRVLVVDNSSSPDVRGVVERRGALYLDPGRNLGYAAAVNLALSEPHVRQGDVLLLNPDAWISPTDVERLRVAAEESPDVACVAPSHRSPGSTSSVDPWWRWNTPMGSWREAIGIHGSPRSSGYLSGAVLLLRRRALDEVGPFDERFFLYAEDQDWQKRVVGRGWRLSHCDRAIATHDAGGTQSNLVRLQLRLHAATERYIRKWYGASGWALYRAAVIVGQSARLVIYSAARRRPNARSAAARLLRLYLLGPDRTATRDGAVPPAGVP